MRGQCLRRGQADPARPATQARAALGHDRQHHLHGRQDLHPLSSWYHAATFALAASSDCLRMALGSFGLKVVIEPGGNQTEWGGSAAEKVRAVTGTDPYAAQGN